jgi:hypothetical protein
VPLPHTPHLPTSAVNISLRHPEQSSAATSILVARALSTATAAIVVLISLLGLVQIRATEISTANER